MIQIAVCGAKGRMGGEILNLLNRDPNWRVVGRVDKAFVNPKKNEFKAVDDLNPNSIDVVIDFTEPQGFREILGWCLRHKIALVSGTTGLDKKSLKEMTLAGRTIPLLWSPNMSLGIHLMAELLTQFSKISHFDFEISETHHKTKKDKPSGTAVFLQEILQRAIKKKIPRPHSFRLGGVFGIHQILAASAEEQIILEHRALNRKVFAQGALYAAKWIIDKAPGVYTFRDILGGC